MPVPLPVTLDRGSSTPLGSQLATQVRTRVLDGTLRHGDRLPGSRSLAAELGASRSVVEQAYEQLVAEGWVEGRHGAGTFVASRALAPATAPPRPPAEVRPPPVDLVGLDTGTPWVDPRHAAGWRRAWREVSTARAPRGYPDHRGLPLLREALAGHLARTRGLTVAPDEVRVTSGTVDGLRLLLQVLGPGDVAVEDPGYRAAVAVARAAGREVRDVPALGPLTDLVGCAALYVTPAHQHPLGRVLPAGERLALLDAARGAGTLVVEDDYDSELRYDVAPVPAMAALDPERVAYLGSASKAVAPSLRLGWLVAPPAVLAAIDAHRAVTHDGPSWPAQHALAVMLRDGHVDKVVRSARRVYRRRAPRVVERLAPHAELAGPAAGMYTTWLLPEADAVRARDAALAAGFRVPLLSDYCRSARLSGLVVGFGGVSDDELDRALDVIVAALASEPGTSVSPVNR